MKVILKMNLGDEEYDFEYVNDSVIILRKKTRE